MKDSKTEEEETLITVEEDFNKLILEFKSKRRIFKESSRMLCCLLFSFSMLAILVIFYLFDVVKYNSTCLPRNEESFKTSKYFEICEVISLSVETKVTFVSVISFLLIFGLYCSGNTIIILDSGNDTIEINKKKFFILPSKTIYKLSNLKYAEVEFDSVNSNGSNHIGTLFKFHSIILKFSNQKDEIVNIGLGRDCFFQENKLEMKEKINEYIKAHKISNTYLEKKKKEENNIEI